MIKSKGGRQQAKKRPGEIFLGVGEATTVATASRGEVDIDTIITGQSQSQSPSRHTASRSYRNHHQNRRSHDAAAAAAATGRFFNADDDNPAFCMALGAMLDGFGRCEVVEAIKEASKYYIEDDHDENAEESFQTPLESSSEGPLESRSEGDLIDKLASPLAASSDTGSDSREEITMDGNTHQDREEEPRSSSSSSSSSSDDNNDEEDDEAEAEADEDDDTFFEDDEFSISEGSSLSDDQHSDFLMDFNPLSDLLQDAHAWRSEDDDDEMSMETELRSIPAKRDHKRMSIMDDHTYTTNKTTKSVKLILQEFREKTASEAKKNGSKEIIMHAMKEMVVTVLGGKHETTRGIQRVSSRNSGTLDNVLEQKPQRTKDKVPPKFMPITILQEPGKSVQGDCEAMTQTLTPNMSAEQMPEDRLSHDLDITALLPSRRRIQLGRKQKRANSVDLSPSWQTTGSSSKVSLASRLMRRYKRNKQAVPSISDAHLDLLGEALAADCVQDKTPTAMVVADSKDSKGTISTTDVVAELKDTDVVAEMKDTVSATDVMKDKAKAVSSKSSLLSRIQAMDLNTKTMLLRSLTKVLRRSQLKRLVVAMALAFNQAESKNSKKLLLLSRPNNGTNNSKQVSGVIPAVLPMPRDPKQPKQQLPTEQVGNITIPAELHPQPQVATIENCFSVASC